MAALNTNDRAFPKVPQPALVARDAAPIRPGFKWRRPVRIMGNETAVSGPRSGSSRVAYELGSFERSPRNRPRAQATQDKYICVAYLSQEGAGSRGAGSSFGTPVSVAHVASRHPRSDESVWGRGGFQTRPYSIFKTGHDFSHADSAPPMAGLYRLRKNSTPPRT